MHSKLLVALPLLSLGSASFLESYIPWTGNSKVNVAERAANATTPANGTVPAFPIQSPAPKGTPLPKQPSPKQPGPKSPGPKSPAPKQPGVGGGSNSANVLATDRQIANGLGLNLMIQQGELAAATDLLTMMTVGKTNDKKIFTAANDNLMTFINAGIKIRTNNMQLAKDNPQLIRGLAQLEGIQVKELALAKTLTGDAARDIATLTSLQRSFSNGINANRGLQQEVNSERLQFAMNPQQQQPPQPKGPGGAKGPTPPAGSPAPLPGSGGPAAPPATSPLPKGKGPLGKDPKQGGQLTAGRGRLLGKLGRGRLARDQDED